MGLNVALRLRVFNGEVVLKVPNESNKSLIQRGSASYTPLCIERDDPKRAPKSAGEIRVKAMT